jgi:hypothetical protein
LVAGQDVEPGDTPGSWRIARKVAKDRIISTVDPQTRHMHKSRSNCRDVYKAHLAVEPETGISTAVELTQGWLPRRSLLIAPEVVAAHRCSLVDDTGAAKMPLDPPVARHGRDYQSNLGKASADTTGGAFVG